LLQIVFILGRLCNIRVENPCFVNPCLNGVCVLDKEPGEFSCNCYRGYFGPLCGTFIEG